MLACVPLVLLAVGTVNQLELGRCGDRRVEITGIRQLPDVNLAARPGPFPEGVPI